MMAGRGKGWWNREAVAYAFTSFSAAAIHNIFITYYVHLFMTIHQLDHKWFYFGETVYMIWNSVNDPLFGWFLEGTTLKQRIQVIKYGGFAWVLAFLCTFVPTFGEVNSPLIETSLSIFGDEWRKTIVGIHFIFSICFYDGVLSLVLLTHAALLADISIESSQRAMINTYSSIFSVIGSNTVLISQIFWASGSTQGVSFQMYCVAVGAVALFGFLYTGFYLPRYVPIQHNEVSSPGAHTEQRLTVTQFGKQLLRFKNFWIFVAIYLIQVFNCHFNSNFISIFLESFIGADLPVFAQSIVLSAAATLPHLVVVAAAPLVASKSLYTVMCGLFSLKLFLALAAFTVLGGTSPPAALAGFLLLNKVFNEAICRHGNLIVADLVDEDYSINKRKESASTILYGANALFTKPGQSLAPMLGWSALNYAGYSAQGDSALPTPVTVKVNMFNMLIILPSVCAILQLLLWSRFSLRGVYLQLMKEHRKKHIEV